jgi:hypothetical protein
MVAGRYGGGRQPVRNLNGPSKQVSSAEFANPAGDDRSILELVRTDQAMTRNRTEATFWRRSFAF